MNLHISNLSLDVLEYDLQRLFAPFGEIRSVDLVRDKLNNRSRGRAFIDMPVEKEGLKAQAALNGSLLKGKLISIAVVNYDPGYGSHLISAKE
ncbi:MAG TPA: RNA-binding protein [Flavisolibacter sp.]|nr:RNA-binding protein [Flavisolibacter sp.]